MELNLLSILLLLALVQLSRADDVRIISNGGGGDQAKETKANRKETTTNGKETAPVDSEPARVPTEKLDIVRQFFQFEGIDPDLDGATLDRYEQKVVDKMAELLENKDDFVTAYRLNREINSLIFELAKERATRADEQKVDENVEGNKQAAAKQRRLSLLMQTIDLMVPNSEWDQTFKLAKDDLSEFCREQPDRCGQLLGRIGALLKRKEFNTLDAIMSLESFYYNWVPLGRLTKHLEEFGQESSEPLD